MCFINRYKWNKDELNTLLADKKSHNSKVFNAYLQMLRRRSAGSFFMSSWMRRAKSFCPCIR